MPALEDEFWQSAPNYPPPSTPPVLIVEPRVQRSRVRAIFAKLLFFVMFSAVVTLLSYEISVVRHVPWLHPRLWLRLAQKIFHR